MHMEMKHRLPGALSIVLQKIEAIRVKSVEQLLRYLLRNARRTAEHIRRDLKQIRKMLLRQYQRMSF